jgi:hypothetical protein
MLPNSFYEGNMTLISKPDKDRTKTQLETMDAKFLNKILAN